MKEHTNSQQHYFELKEIPPLKLVGGYRLGKPTNLSIQFNLTYKPNWFHRTMMRVCFGLYWTEDNIL